MTIGLAREAAASRARSAAGRQGLGLPDSLGFGISAGRAIFLDLLRDRYFSIELDPGPDRLRGLAAMLRDEGLLVRGGRSVGPTIWPIASRQLDPLCPAGPQIGGPGDLVQVAARLLKVRRDLRRGQLHSLVRRAAVPAGRAGQSGEAELLAARFHACRRLIPIRPNCLLDSLALLHFLAGRGVRATLVFGAKFDPFAAHCWVEQEGMLLNESSDVAGQFVAVLAAG